MSFMATLASAFVIVTMVSPLKTLSKLWSVAMRLRRGAQREWRTWPVQRQAAGSGGGSRRCRPLRPHSDPITQRQPLSAAVFPFPVEGHLVATALHRDRGMRLRFREAPDVAVDTCAVVGVVARVVERAREVAALGLVVAHDLCALELVRSHLRIPAMQHEETARQPFIAFVAYRGYARRTRISGILPIA